MLLPTEITLTDIQRAATTIQPYVIQTPCLPNEFLSHDLDLSLRLKAENLQHVGAFKARGATNAVLMLSDDAAARGVVTHSSGNHAAAVARAARLRNIPATIVMPHNSAAIKIQNVRSLGVKPVFCKPTAEARQQMAADYLVRTGGTLIHPYDQLEVIAGQGTVGLEILEQVPDVTTIVVPVGGGGLLAGILTAVKTLRPQVHVIAAEPEQADDTARSLASGRIEPPTRYDTIADGLRTPLGQLTFPVIRDLVDRLVLVSESEIVAAMNQLSHATKTIVEPSGAVAFAAVRRISADLSGQSVVAVISGGNRDVA